MIRGNFTKTRFSTSDKSDENKFKIVFSGNFDEGEDVTCQQ